MDSLPEGVQGSEGESSGWRILGAEQEQTVTSCILNILAHLSRTF